MNTTTRITTAERFGRWLGRGWRGYVRGEQRVLAWLVAKGVPMAVAAVLVWAVKLAILGGLLYVAFWVALLILFTMVAGWAAKNPDQDNEDYPWAQEDELRYGEAGFGIYTADGHRIDPHDPNAPFDT